MVQSTTQLLYFKVFITCIHNYIHLLCLTVIERIEHHRPPVLRTAGSLPLCCSPGFSGEGEPTPAPRCARLPLPHTVGESPALWAGTGPASEPGEVARQRGRGRRAVAYRRDTAPAGDDGRRRGRAAARRRRTSPERGEKRGATGRTRTSDPRPGAAARPRTSPERSRAKSGGAASTRARARRPPGGGGWRVPGPVTRSQERWLRSLDARDPGRRWAVSGACQAAVAVSNLFWLVKWVDQDDAHALSEPGHRDSYVCRVPLLGRDLLEYGVSI